MEKADETDPFLILFEIVGVLARRRFLAAERSFSSLGLNHTEARLLSLLQEAGGACAQEALSGRTFLDRSNVGRALKRLEDEGFTVRRKDSADRRSNRVQITAKGRKAVAAMTGIRTKMAQNFFGDLRSNEARTIIHAFKKSLTVEEYEKICRRVPE